MSVIEKQTFISGRYPQALVPVFQNAGNEHSLEIIAEHLIRVEVVPVPTYDETLIVRAYSHISPPVAVACMQLRRKLRVETQRRVVL